MGGAWLADVVKDWEKDDSDRREGVLPRTPFREQWAFAWLPIESNQRSGAADRPPMSFRGRRGRCTEDHS